MGSCWVLWKCLVLPELMTWTNAEGKGGEGGLSSASSKGFFPSEITAFKLWTHLEVTANMCSVCFFEDREMRFICKGGRGFLSLSWQYDLGGNWRQSGGGGRTPQIKEWCPSLSAIPSGGAGRLFLNVMDMHKSCNTWLTLVVIMRFAPLLRWWDTRLKSGGWWIPKIILTVSLQLWLQLGYLS